MPANIPLRCKKYELKYLAASSIEEKISALEEYLACIPKHKGTEKLCAMLRRKLSRLRSELERSKQSRKFVHRESLLVKKEGDAQVVLLGFTNAGRSSLLAKLTSAKPHVAAYPYTTQRPIPGMMNYEGVRIQLVEAPALDAPDKLAGLAVTLARNCDLVTLVLDASSRVQENLRKIMIMLEERGILPLGRKPPVIVEKTGSGGIQVIELKRIGCNIGEIQRFLRNMGYVNARVKIFDEIELRDVALALNRSNVYKPFIVVVNKVDLNPLIPHEIKDIMKQFSLGNSIILVSAEKNLGLDVLKRKIFERLNLIRVYTKEPGENPSDKPLVLARGSTIRDLCIRLHEDFLRGFQYARVWGKSVKVGGDRVGLNHTLEDGDIVEIKRRI